MVALNTRRAEAMAWAPPLGEVTTLVATTTTGTWPAGTRMVVGDSSDTIATGTVLGAAVVSVDGLTATWALDEAQCAILRAHTRLLVQVPSGAAWDGVLAGAIAPEPAWSGARAVQTVGSVLVGPQGPPADPETIGVAVADYLVAHPVTAPVQSVAGRTGAVTLAVADVSGAVDSTDGRLSDPRTPTAHKASHATGGTDALTPADIGAAAADADLGGNFTSGTATAGQAPLADGAGAVAWGNVASGGPIATFTQAGNTSVTVTAVDVGADTLTAVGHGLANGDVVIPFSNPGITAALRQYLPGGLTCQRYYVIGAAADTFQLSLTSGGAAIDLTVRATVDFTKWHLETAGSPLLGFSGLNAGRYRFVLHGQGLAEGNTYWGRVAVNDSPGVTTSDSIQGGVGPPSPTWVRVSMEVTFDMRGGVPTIVGWWRSVAQKATDGDAVVVARTITENALIASTPMAAITSVGLYKSSGPWYWANGTTMEVYA